MADAKPRRSIFDTLKKSAGPRLGLAEAAKVADKISHFPEATSEAEPVVPAPEATAPEATVVPNGTTKRYNQMVQPDVPNGTTTRYNRSNQMVQPSGTTERYNHLVQPGTEKTTEPNLVEAKPKRLNAQQQRVLDHLISQGPHITDKSILSEKLGIAPFTVRNILIRLTHLGLITRKRIGQGMHIAALQKNVVQPDGTTIRYNQVVQPDGTTIRYNQAPLKIDRFKSLSISLEDMSMHWPNLVRCGFGPDQLAQIEGSLLRVGKSTERIVQGLDHAEWELANAAMCDKQGQPVADPCSWVFRSLVQTGYYRRPKRYVSPEEQALHDAEEEARAVLAARQKAEQAQFEAWKDGLSPEALREAMQACPGGPKEAWLKRVWKERTEPPAA